MGYWAVSHLESCQASAVGPLYEGGQRFGGLTMFPGKALSRMFGWIPGVPPIVGVVNGG